MIRRHRTRPEAPRAEQLISSVNNVKANKIQVGQTLKLIRGPFHAVVYKGRFILDCTCRSPTVTG